MEINYDKFCKRCQNYSSNLSQGILCALTNEKPSFKNDCKDFKLDPVRDKKLNALEKEYSERWDNIEKYEKSENIFWRMMSFLGI